MSLIQEAQQYVTPRARYNTCAIELAKRDHTDIADQIDELLESEFVASVVHNTFLNHDIDVSIGTIRKHRRRDCRCR